MGYLKIRAPILFDTGMKGSILLANMEKLGIDPSFPTPILITLAVSRTSSMPIRM